jgi:hypothetical protein
MVHQQPQNATTSFVPNGGERCGRFDLKILASSLPLYTKPVSYIHANNAPLRAGRGVALGESLGTVRGIS